MPASCIFRRVSPSCRWLSSCATMPCSSSRLRWSSAPWVTAITASSSSQPAAKALMASVRASTTGCGRATPPAMHSSSSTLQKRCSACDTPGRASRAPTLSARRTPPARSCEVSSHQPPNMNNSERPTFTAKKPVGYDNETGNTNEIKADISSQASISAPCTDGTTSSTASANPNSKRRVALRAASWWSKKRTTNAPAARRARPRWWWPPAWRPAQSPAIGPLSSQETAWHRC